MIEKIDYARIALFKQQKQNVLSLFIESLEEMSSRYNNLDEKSKIAYAKYITVLNKCFSNGDFLAVSDIIKFNLLPLFVKRGF